VPSLSRPWTFCCNKPCPGILYLPLLFSIRDPQLEYHGLDILFCLLELFNHFLSQCITCFNLHLELFILSDCPRFRFSIWTENPSLLQTFSTKYHPTTFYLYCHPQQENKHYFYSHYQHEDVQYVSSRCFAIYAHYFQFCTRCAFQRDQEDQPGTLAGR